MSGRLLDIKAYLSGSDNVQCIELFPSNQKQYTYSFGEADLTNYTWQLDYQSVLLDTVTYQRNSGEPNFADTTVTGYFDNLTTITEPNANINVTDAATGTVIITIPDDRYTGRLLPNARSNVVMTVFSVQWTNNNVTPPTTDLHRWAIIERWEPEVAVGDPADETSPAFNLIT